MISHTFPILPLVHYSEPTALYKPPPPLPTPSTQHQLPVLPLLPQHQLPLHIHLSYKDKFSYSQLTIITGKLSLTYHAWLAYINPPLHLPLFSLNINFPIQLPPFFSLPQQHFLSSVSICSTHLHYISCSRSSPNSGKSLFTVSSSSVLYKPLFPALYSSTTTSTSLQLLYQPLLSIVCITTPNIFTRLLCHFEHTSSSLALPGGLYKPSSNPSSSSPQHQHPTSNIHFCINTHPHISHNLQYITYHHSILFNQHHRKYFPLPPSITPWRSRGSPASAEGL